MKKLSTPGATLLLVMIVLILMALFAVSLFKTSVNNIRVVGNMQARQEAIAAAQQAIELVLSSDTFTTDPDLVSQSPLDVDIDGDGVVDYIVRFSPKPNCYRVTTLPNCGARSSNSSGMDGSLMEGGPGGVASAAVCFVREWNVRALVTDPRSGASVAINQGVSVPSSDDGCE